MTCPKLRCVRQRHKRTSHTKQYFNFDEPRDGDEHVLLLGGIRLHVHLIVATVLAEYINLWFTMNTWTREVMVKLAEMGFDLVIHNLLQDDIDANSECMKTSAPCENQINVLRRVERGQRSCKLGRLARWHRLLTSRVRYVVTHRTSSTIPM